MNFLGSFLTSLKPRFDDDIVDRLNYYYSCLIILILAITISAKQYVGQPIQCWVPAQFTGAWEQYAENYCFVQNTYWLPLKDPIPPDYRNRIIRQIGYYQWVPFILAIQALLFYVPCVIWRLLNWQSGINVQSVVTMAADTQNIGIEPRQRSVKTISRHIEDALELQREIHGRNHQNHRPSVEITHLWRRATSGTYVTTLYLSVKLMYLVNILGQFFLLSTFLNPQYRFWGAEILIDLANGREWMDSGHFPRVTMCDFEVRVLGNLHRHTIQCVLMINMFNEKIYLFLWWWFLFIIIADILNFVYWLLASLTYKQRGDFVERYLRVGELMEKPDPPDSHQPLPPVEPQSVGKFVNSFLRLDGVFILRMISNHAGDLIATEIVSSLWRSFCTRYIASPYAVPRPSVQFNLGKTPIPAMRRQSHVSNRGPKSQFFPPLLEYQKAADGDALPVDSTVTDKTDGSPAEESGFIEAYYIDPSKQQPPMDQTVKT